MKKKIIMGGGKKQQKIFQKYFSYRLAHPAWLPSSLRPDDSIKKEKIICKTISYSHATWHENDPRLITEMRTIFFFQIALQRRNFDEKKQRKARKDLENTSDSAKAITKLLQWEGFQFLIYFVLQHTWISCTKWRKSRIKRIEMKNF